MVLRYTFRNEIAENSNNEYANFEFEIHIMKVYYLQYITIGKPNRFGFTKKSLQKNSLYRFNLLLFKIVKPANEDSRLSDDSFSFETEPSRTFSLNSSVYCTTT